MNLNQSLSFSDLHPNKLIPLLLGYQRWIVGSIVIAVMGYTGYQLSLAVAVPATATYSQDTAKVPSLTLKQDTLRQLQALQNPGGNDAAVPVGKQNPFAD